MPRASRAEAEETRRKIIEVSFDIAMNEGIENLTFSNIAKRLKIARSGTNAHFKKKSDILKEIEPKIKIIIKHYLDFDSPESFYDSWVYAIDNESEFVKAILASGGLISPTRGIGGLFNLIRGDENEVKKSVLMAIGYAVLSLDDGKEEGELE